MAISAKSKILASDINTALSGKQDALGYIPVKSVNGVSANSEGNVSLSGGSSAVAYITSKGGSNTKWYRVYSDNFKIQGGIAQSSTTGMTTITFSTAFSSTPVVLGGEVRNSSNSALSPRNRPFDITTTSFSIYVSTTSTTPINWVAFGF